MTLRAFFLLLSITATGYAAAPISRLPFTYVIDYTPLQESDSDFRRQFLQAAPTLFHPGPELRYLGRFGFGGMVTPYRNMPYATYETQVKEYLDFLRAQGVRWVTPYLCNQTISGNEVHRYGVWEVYDRWPDFAFLGLGEKPEDPILWMQREPSGHLHYNYKRKCFLERHQDDLQIRYAPCPNHPDWRNLCNAEARNAGRIGFDGYFIDNNIIHCYCAACEQRFQSYLRAKYSADELFRAFATRDYRAITLYHEGDLRWWARSIDGFIPWLESKYPQPEWPIHFDAATSLQEVNVDAAGGGMLYGETEQFVAERILSVASPTTFESLRLANPALQTPIGRLRWAETQMFWSQSIGDMLAEMRDAGRETHADFFLMPNWGVFQRIDGAIGRAEDGKDVRRWRRGADWQMFEEDYATGLVAPGVVLDYDLELRYAFSCGIRALLLPYTLNDPALEEVHHAETAASGGSVFVTTFRYPQVREKYRRFFETNADLYEGYSSAGRVALAFFFDQYYYLNIDHFRQVYALNRFLADQQIPFDLIHEDCLEPGPLSRYQAIILPNVVFLSDGQIAALKAYVGQGGTLISIGETATRDLYCRPRDAAVFNDRIKPGKHRRHFSDLHQALPHRGIDLDDGLRAVRKLKAGGKSVAYQRLAELDDALHFKRFQLKGPLTDCIAEALGGDPHLMDPMQASGLRHTLWRKQQDRRVWTVVHLVNKNVRLDVEDGLKRLKTVTNLKVALPAEPGRRRALAVYRTPDQETAFPLISSYHKGQVVVTVPTLSYYGVIQIEWM